MEFTQPLAHPTDAPAIARKLWQLLDPHASGAVGTDTVAQLVRQTSAVGRLPVSEQSTRGFCAVLDHDGDGRISSSDVEQLVLRYFCGAGAVQAVSGTADPFRLHPGPAVGHVGQSSQSRHPVQSGWAGVETQTQHVATTSYLQGETGIHSRAYTATYSQSESRYPETVQLAREADHSRQYLRADPPTSSQPQAKVVSLQQLQALQTQSVKTAADEPYGLFQSFEPAAGPRPTMQTPSQSQAGSSANSTNSSTHTIYRPAVAPSLRAQLAALDPHNTGSFPTAAVGPLIAQAYREAGIATEPSAADVQSYTDMLDYRQSGRVSTEDFEGLIVRALTGGQTAHQ